MLNLSNLFFYVKKEGYNVAKKKPSKLVHCLLPLSATALLNVAYAQTDVLDEIVVNAEQSALAGSAVENYQAISNHVIKKERLQKNRQL